MLQKRSRVTNSSPYISITHSIITPFALQSTITVLALL